MMQAWSSSFSEMINNFIDLFTKVTLFIMISMLWAMCSLPVVTLPASTTAVILSWRALKTSGGYRSTLRTFFMCFKKSFFKSLLIGIPVLLSLGITYLNLIFFVKWSTNIFVILYIGVMCFVDFILLMVGLSALAFLSKRCFDSKQAVLIALRSIFGQLGKSILITVGVIAAASFTVFVSKLGVLMFGGFIGWSANQLIKRR